MTNRLARPPLVQAGAVLVGMGMLVGGAVAAEADPVSDVTPTNPRPSLSPRPIPTPQATITIQTFLAVTARAARDPIPRNGKVSLVREVTTEPGQKATTRTRITVRPKRARAAIKVRTRDDGSIIVRTRDSRRARVQIRIRADGPDTTPTTWVRTWRVR
jgi:hypothetical protein